MDGEYLKGELGLPLATAVAETCLQRPADPIEYIAQRLYHHRKLHQLQNAESAEGHVSTFSAYML